MKSKAELKFIELLKKPNKSKEDVEERTYWRLKFDQELRDEMAELNTKLKALGIGDYVWDLVNTSQKYPKAIPILIDHLSKPYHIKNKEGIARALSVKEAKGIACEAILEEYFSTSRDKTNYRWVLGSAMEVTITKEYIDPVIQIVIDQKNDRSRQMFIRGLRKFKKSEIKEAMELLLSDSDDAIRKEAEKVLKKYR